jgi:hypothetical protein
MRKGIIAAADSANGFVIILADTYDPEVFMSERLQGDARLRH